MLKQILMNAKQEMNGFYVDSGQHKLLQQSHKYNGVY